MWVGFGVSYTQVAPIVRHSFLLLSTDQDLELLALSLVQDLLSCCCASRHDANELNL